MASNNRVGTKTPKWVNPASIPGTLLSPGPYIGVVKNNVDANRSGRIEVFIEEFGGLEGQPSHWITVQYASPYLGASRWPGVRSAKNKENTFKTVNHTYGMWFTPPDIGNFVLVTFVGGKISRGFWFACVMPELTHYAIPGIAGSNFLKLPDDAALAAAVDQPPYPVVEYNDANEGNISRENEFLTIPKPIHEPQFLHLLKEGLENDKKRGVLTSSSQRESPSRVFGISTPGRDGPDKDKDTQAVENRLGGHTFVMDDGDESDQNDLIRLRTAAGHQILMNDSEKVIYISNSSGTVWMEFTDDGKIHVFSESDVNVRSNGTLNLHAEKDIHMHAKENITMWAGTSIHEQTKDFSIKGTTTLKMFGQETELSSGSTLKLQSATTGSWANGGDLILSTGGKIYLNTMPAPSVPTPGNIPINTFKETIPTKPAPIYKYKVNSSITSTVAELTAHEPWVKHASGGSSAASGGSSAASGGSSAASGGAPGAGPAGASGQGVLKPTITNDDILKQTPGVDSIGKMNPSDVAALKAQLAKTESGGKYDAENQFGYVGKYQFGSAALAGQGYMKPGVKQSVANMNNPDNWTGKDGIHSIADFKANQAVQEKVMDTNLENNYKQLLKSKTVTSDSSPADIAGKLSVAHLLGAGGASKWAKGGGGQDANGTTGDKYYNNGKYAVVTAAAKNNPPTSG